jgi:hypothetical protein
MPSSICYTSSRSSCDVWFINVLFFALSEQIQFAHGTKTVQLSGSLGKTLIRINKFFPKQNARPQAQGIAWLFLRQD